LCSSTDTLVTLTCHLISSHSNFQDFELSPVCFTQSPSLCHIKCHTPNKALNHSFSQIQIQTIRELDTFCGTRYLPHSQVHDERTVPIIMAGCITHARNGHISTSAFKSDITIVFLDLDFPKYAKVLAIRIHLRQI